MQKIEFCQRDKVAKNVYDKLSQDTYQPRVSHIVEGTASKVMDCLDDFTNAMASFRVQELFDSQSVSRHVQPEDMDISDVFVHMVRDVVQDPYSLVASGQIQSEVSRAMGAPVKLALNANLGHLTGHVRVLVLGAGYGNDVLRITKALSSASSCEIVCVEPDYQRAAQCRKENVGKFTLLGKTIVVHVIEGTYQSSYDTLSFHGPYDAIIATYSIQHIIGNAWDAPYEKFTELMNPNAVCVGCYFDHDSFFSMQADISLASNNQIHVGPLRQATLADRCDPIVGIRPTRVLGTDFDDPYVSQEIVHGFAMVHRLQYQVYRGQAIFQAQRRYQSKKFDASTRYTNKCSSLCTVVIFRKAVDVPIPSYCHETSFVPNVPPGKHASLADLSHYRCNTYAVAIKRDGIGVVGVLSGTSFKIYKNKEEIMTFPAIPFARPVYLQMEFIEKSGDLYVLDVLPESFVTSDVPFLYRYSFAKVMVQINCSNVPGLKLNEHSVVRSVADIDIWKSRMYPPAGFAVREDPPEGLVIVPLSGNVAGRFSVTRYIKRVITGDILDTTGVKEYPRELVGVERRRKRSPEGSDITLEELYVPRYKWSDVPIRDRPDKEKPNPDSILDELLKAPDIEVCFQELARNCDWEFDWSHLPGLGKDYVYLPRDKSVPPDVWLALYTMRSTVPLEHSAKVQGWLVKVLQEIRDKAENSSIGYEEEYDYCGVHHMMSQGMDDDSLSSAALSEAVRSAQFAEEEAFLEAEFGPPLSYKNTSWGSKRVPKH